MPAVLIVAHAPLATALKAVAAHVYADCGHPIEALDVPPNADVGTVKSLASDLIEGDTETEWLVLTDVFGATPCNAMTQLAQSAPPERHLRVVAGVNVPMLWRTLCYADDPLDTLTARAMAGASQGVVLAAPAAQSEQDAQGTRASDQVDHHHPE